MGVRCKRTRRGQRSRCGNRWWKWRGTSDQERRGLSVKVPEDQLLDTLRYELEHWGE
mgnify:CR=1 FL=1